MSAAEGLDVQPINAVRPSAATRPADEQLVLVRHDQLAPSPFNPRKHAREAAEIVELAASIADKGVLHNLVARPLKGQKDRYEIAAGEGRWRAVKHLIDTKAAPADYRLRVAVRALTDDQMIEIGLVENGRRRNLHPLDEARAFHALYDAKVKAAGGKGKAAGLAAGAGVVRDLAASVGRTPRYVQLQIKVARDLQPKAVEYLEAGAIGIDVARRLARRSKDEQRTFLSQHSKVRLAEMTAAEVDRHFADRWRPMDEAIFERGLYRGPTDEIDGTLYATDRAAFDKLQHAAAAQFKAEALKAVKGKKIAFFDEGEWFSSTTYEVRKVNGAPDPAGGVFLERKSYERTIRIHRGLHKTKWAIAREKEQAKWKAQGKRHRDVPKAKRDPRVAQVRAFCERSPETLMALDLYRALNRSYSDSVQFYRGDWCRDRQTVIDALAPLRRGKLPAGATLLAWLLKLKPAALLKAWSVLAATAVRDVQVYSLHKGDRVLFDHCGAKLPPKAKPDPKAAPAAKKPKPAKTKKKGRK